MQPRKQILEAPRMERAIRRMAIEIAEKSQGLEDIILVGIYTRGVPLAERLARELCQHSESQIQVGCLDHTLYRDDLDSYKDRPVKPTKLPTSIDGKVVILVDDVFHTGRTVRAAMHALIDLGRPRRIMLAVLVNRLGRRACPLYPDFAGKDLPTDANEWVQVRLSETDDEQEGVFLMPSKSHLSLVD